MFFWLAPCENHGAFYVLMFFTYTIQITKIAGQQIKAGMVQVENNNTLRTIKMGTAATGNYQATITDELGNKTTISFLVK